MTNFQTTTVVESKEPSNDLAVVAGNTVLGGALGMNPDIVAARGIMIGTSATGQHIAAIVDYSASREVPLVVTERTISEAVHSRLSDSFDKLNGAIE